MVRAVRVAIGWLVWDMIVTIGWLVWGHDCDYRVVGMGA
jgi:hypothetical protein